MPKTRSPEELGERVRRALESSDLDAIGDLLHPDATWGAPDDPKPSCQNRNQVLGWYRQSTEQGVRATVTEVVVSGDKILVGLKVAGRAAADEADRWQVMTVVEGQIADVRGFDDRDEAAHRAGVDAL
jgi:ketosteroid isomerase-like protein